ncbi:VPLPA-CTERM-specific exosortase XrtD [Oceanicella actignis]|uniref:Exosortase D, VPLPA-CTERM-specific n=1 Tax=Oceanicella actignis TaxID=1189325 RepID=A0A1M7T588_9RHOB|nr:VPLPA-CTERM-specific exosortase XrtD [Oceanicella actignis]SET42568.1 exosortase D, VPLPA-CTERM-specific [Oceanicella actignis]SHN65812.1 exosortase D, VPLPA-CTERM-specific [Oceanicella actignis]
MSALAQAGPARAGAVARPGWGAALPAAALAASAAALFAPGLGALARAWSQVEYGHGPVILILSGLIFLKILRRTPAAPAEGGRWQGLALIALAALIALGGRLAGLPEVVAYALPPWVGGVLLTGFGRRAGRRFWPVAAHLVLMLPLPGLLYWQVSSGLQLLSSNIGVALIRAAGAPALLDGNVIDLGVHKLFVAEACSGLRYLFPIMSFAFVLAVLYRGPSAHKALLMLAAAPLAVAANALRVALVGVLTSRHGAAAAQGVDHLLEGWALFALTVAALLALTALLARLGGARSLRAAMDVDLTGAGARLRQVAAARASGPMLAALALTAGAAAGWALAPERPSRSPDLAPLAAFPERLGAWRLAFARPAGQDLRAALGADEMLWRVYAPGAGRADQAVDLLIVRHEDQSRGGLHSPRICMPGGGWEVETMAPRDLGPALGGAAGLTVTRAVVRRGLDRRLVYFWFEQPGRRTPSDLAAKLGILRDGLMLGRTDGALVRLVTDAGRGADALARADARMARFLGAMGPTLAPFSPAGAP